jgi:pyridinium-3,5-biscarboxylic acid mononucleotide sulfurtransferase
MPCADGEGNQTRGTGVLLPAAPEIHPLISLIAELGSAVVAFSGGVDSSVVAALAKRGLGSRAVAVTAVSPALATGELEAARTVAAFVGIRHEVLDTAEMSDPDYRRNDRFRCYFCKSELYGRLSDLAAVRGFASVLSGANADDAHDWRPGLRAAAERGVRHPLLEAGWGKDQVRAVARQLGLPSAAKPASPCLASRIPYGTPVSIEVLSRVDRAEANLRDIGYRTFRVRHYGATGRVQLAADELARVKEPGERAAVVSAVKAVGYRRVDIDDAPFRSGSLNLTEAPPRHSS